MAAYLTGMDVDVVCVDRRTYAASRGRADVVVNASGSSDKRMARSDPRTSFEANVATVLAAVVDFPCDAFVQISSTSVYPDVGDPARCHEDVVVDPASLSPYGRFKLMGEWIVRGEARRWVILRVDNVVGPGLRKNPIYDLLAGSRLFVDPRSAMSFIATGEVARIAWQLRGEAGQVFNVAGDGTVVIGEVAERLGVTLAPAEGSPVLDEHVNVDKLRARSDVPSSAETVLRFCSAVRSGTIAIGG